MDNMEAKIEYDFLKTNRYNVDIQFYGSATGCATGFCLRILIFIIFYNYLVIF